MANWQLHQPEPPGPRASRARADGSDKEPSTVARTPTTSGSLASLYDGQARHFHHWEKTKDVVDQCIDMMLNFRQSGHPGGSRSKVHAMLALVLSGVDALGSPPSREAVRRSLRARRRPLHAAPVLGARRSQRTAAYPVPGHGRRTLSRPRCRTPRGLLGGPAPVPPQRRAFGTRGDGGQDAVRQGEHRAVRSWLTAGSRHRDGAETRRRVRRFESSRWRAKAG